MENQEKTHKTWVWTSTENSREKQKLSVLAVVETIFFVLLTWFVAWYFDSYIHIVTAILIAPLLLLKTPKSIDEGIALFMAGIEFKEKITQNKQSIGVLLLSAAMNFAVSYFLAKQLLGAEGWQVILSVIFIIYIEIVIVMILAITTITTITTAAVIITTALVAAIITIAIAGVWVVIVAEWEKLEMLYTFTVTFVVASIFSIVFAFMLHSLVVKFWVTAKSLHPNRLINTLEYIPINYREQLTVNDCRYSPELLPGIGKENSIFQASGILKKIKNTGNFFKIFLYIFMYSVWLFAYLYRWSIKSTAWFYYPLVYLSDIKKIRNEKKEERAITDQGWIGAVLFNFFATLVVLINFDVIEDFKCCSINIDASKIKPLLNSWIDPLSLWLVIASIVLYIVAISFYSLRKYREKQNTFEKNIFLNKIIHWIIRLKFILWYVFFAWNLGFIWQKFDIWNVIFNAIM